MIIDMDSNDGVIITFTAGGKKLAYSKSTLVAALGVREQPTSRRLMSVSRAVSWVLSDLQSGKLTNVLEVRSRLGAALNFFDGKVSGNPSRLGGLLLAILDHPAGKSCYDIVQQFLKKHPKLGIPMEGI